MGLEVKIECKKSFILATYSGAFDLKDALTMFKEALTASFEKNMPKILIDYRKITGPLSGIDRFRYAEETTKYWREFIRSEKIKTPRIAYLGKQPIVDPERFGDLVAKNRGAFNFKTFEDISKAKEWFHSVDA